ncbi:YlbD family protein [Bacillus sp. CECT 9360]|uniref:YlbD family protein n=1 Tax=Bacillus sp. CECT 9360 TaxID=2845821 RepID=UPI001E4363DF|nr:YlbD family protein [Bacillus sp. CECT 9360]CAH0345965.1 hypothetical protein BCI9360_02274 [Bacillus sp. CECT 9360]
MAQKKVRPSVEEFKRFVKKHPTLRQEVKKGNYSWQELFEEWHMLGGNHEQWDAYKGEMAKAKESNQSNEVNKSDFVSVLLQSFKDMDMNQIQQYISSANQALGAIQGVISSFQGDKPTEEVPEVDETVRRPRPNPFAFRKD